MLYFRPAERRTDALICDEIYMEGDTKYKKKVADLILGIDVLWKESS